MKSDETVISESLLLSCLLSAGIGPGPLQDALLTALCSCRSVSGATKVCLTGTHLVGFGEEVHRVGSLEEVHQGEAVVESGVTICIAFSLQEEGIV